MCKKEFKYDLNDILIQPAVTTDILSRSEINPFTEIGMLPIITAPMDTVINSENEKIFLNNKINVCQSRGVTTNSSNFTSYSLSSFKRNFLPVDGEEFTILTGGKPEHILIDTANGHTSEMLEVVETTKKLYGDKMVLMVGNIANPKTYIKLSNAGADYIRCGIGNGNGCLTTKQLGIGFPTGSLIRECHYASFLLDEPAKIVADGGMKEYSDIIKVLALGADYVMVGSIFNKAVESAGQSYTSEITPYMKISNIEAMEEFKSGNTVYKKFRGMSTKEVQKEWGNKELKTSEGIVKYQKVEYTISGWVENFEAYLRSAMSYTNSKTLKDFCGEVELINITNSAYNRFNK